MKKSVLILFTMIITSTFATSCEKTNGSTGSPTPRTTVPDQLVGLWQIGSFSLTEFWNYDGSYQGNAGSYSLAYKITKDGHAEQFLYIEQNSYGITTRLLGYRKGTVSFDQATGKLEFFGTEGNYRSFMNGKKTEKQYGANDLYPKYSDVHTNCSVVDKENGTYLVTTSKSGNEMQYKKLQ